MGICMESKNYPLVLVKWYDAESHDDWEDISKVSRECKLIETVGFIVADDNNGLTLAMNHDRVNEMVSMIMCLPNHWIESVEYLEGTGTL